MNPPEMDSEQFQRNLEHARAGYTTAQETIKFIDTKTGIMTGVLVITTGLPFLSVNFLASDGGKDMKECLFAHPAITSIISLTLLLGLACGTMSLMSSTNGLMARTPVTGNFRERGLFSEVFCFLLYKLRIKERYTPLFTITSLFPLYPPERTAEALLQFSRIGEGAYSKQDILKEYATQIETIGNILNCKICRNRDSVRWFELQLLSYVLAIAVTILFTASIIMFSGKKPVGVQPVQVAKSASATSAVVGVPLPAPVQTTVPITPLPQAAPRAAEPGRKIQ